VRYSQTAAAACANTAGASYAEKFTGGNAMKIKYNREQCQGHNRCYSLAPELFDVDDEGYAILLVEGEVPDELKEKAQLCADNCPEFAIEIEE